MKKLQLQKDALKILTDAESHLIGGGQTEPDLGTCGANTSCNCPGPTGTECASLDACGTNTSGGECTVSVVCPTLYACPTDSCATQPQYGCGGS